MHNLVWYVARSSGIVAWTLLTLSVVWGLAMTTQIVRGRVRRPWLLDLHRFLGGLAVIFTGVHVGALLVDSYVHFDVVQVLVPFTASWRPGAVAWGIAGMYLLLAVELTSLVRRRLPNQVWHAIHLASFPLFFVATIHGLQAGTDAHSAAYRVATITAIAVVTGLTAARVVKDTRRPVASGTPAPRRPPVRTPASAPAVAPAPVRSQGDLVHS